MYHRPRLLMWLCVVGAFPVDLLAVASPPPKQHEQPPPGPPRIIPPGEVFISDADYNEGAYGQYVTQTFKTANITAPRLNMMKPFDKCDDGSFLFFSPRGEVVQDTTAAIYDPSGSLIWKLPDGAFHDVYNFQMQQYKGQQCITFWSGDNSGGHGEGFHYILDQQYNVTRKITAGNGLDADLHSFTILPDGNALLTSYVTITADALPFTEPTPMLDCLFQEVDIESGSVLFEWRASQHFNLTESYVDHAIASEEEPWDFFHINSVEKDAAGNYLVSSRHLRCISYISGWTGEVLWRLGGKRNDFTDLSAGDATRFVGQHDAHFVEGGRFVTFFDNRADWAFELEHVSKGRRIEIDTKKMTARVDATYVHPQRIFAFSQGSYQTLPNGNVLLGYGFTGAVAEFDRNGTLLCDAFLQPSSRFSSGDVQSYRNLKFNWTGLPDTRPSALVEDGILYVSWLGSTEVKSWWLQDSTGGEDDRWASASIFKRSGFETQISLDNLLLRQYIRLVALDADHLPLRTSETLSIGQLASVFHPVTAEEAAVTDPTERVRFERRWQDLGALVGFAILALGTAAIVSILSIKPRLVHRWSVAEQERGEFHDDKEADGVKMVQMWERLTSTWSARREWAAYRMLPQRRVEERTSSEIDVR